MSHTTVGGIFQIVIFLIPTVYFFDLMVSIASRPGLLTIETIKSKKYTVGIEESDFPFFRVGGNTVLDWSDKKTKFAQRTKENAAMAMHAACLASVEDRVK